MPPARRPKRRTRATIPSTQNVRPGATDTKPIDGRDARRFTERRPAGGGFRILRRPRLSEGD
ncbi:MAG TPA: hypothetical protein PKC45_02375 [Gemmatales bacterium]|nr:hypothetical protein [Gemmatales bacterium]